MEEYTFLIGKKVRIDWEQPGLDPDKMKKHFLEGVVPSIHNAGAYLKIYCISEQGHVGWCFLPRRNSDEISKIKLKIQILNWNEKEVLISGCKTDNRFSIMDFDE